MLARSLFRSLGIIFLSLIVACLHPAFADPDHARIVRLSLVEGDVRFARDVQGDPLASDAKIVWEAAELNLPIRQGYVIATDNGRAEVEFETGAMAFLSQNTVIQFYDLSLDNGAFITRLVLRQGTASFYVNPAPSDYFSVTGGDFTVEADGRTTFRLDNFDDGSTVNVENGNVELIRQDTTTPLTKGESVTVKAGDTGPLVIGRLSDEDDFDGWVSGRIDSVTTATDAALQYASSPQYTSGLADLYTYGAFFNCGGYAAAWRPLGVGPSWTPFGAGSWYYDPAFSWAWVSSSPWGWMPAHFGSWAFNSGCGGWYYIPPVYSRGGVPPGRRLKVVHPPFPAWKPATVVWVHNHGQLGFVPIHPLDAANTNKTPLNMAHGIFTADRTVSPAIAPIATEEWKTEKKAPREALRNSLAPATPPERVSRTVISGVSGSRVITMDSNSSIVYDPHEHRFVNAETPSSESQVNRETRSESENGGSKETIGNRIGVATVTTGVNRGTTPTTSAPVATSHVSQPPPSSRVSVPPPTRNSGEGGGSSGRGESSGGSGRVSGGGGSASANTGGGSRASSGGGGGGGRPH